MVLGAFTANAQSVVEGTKLTDNPKDYMLRVRMDNDTLNRLDDLCEKYNTNRSVIVRMGIDKLYQDK